MNNCAVVIPIYKFELSPLEKKNIEESLIHLEGFDIYFIAPKSLDVTNYKFNSTSIKLQRFEDFFFESISNYSRLLLSKEFYLSFSDSYTHILILQTDARVLKPDLHYWINQSFDYIGAPWKEGYQLQIKTNKIPIANGVLCRTQVGNGGLCLRKIQSCLDLFVEFDDIHDDWIKYGHAEDLFFGFLGNISSFFILPNIYQAAKFSHETDSSYFYSLIGNQIPFGIHGNDKYPFDYLTTDV